MQYRFTKFTFYACLQKERVQKNLAHSTMGQWKLIYKKTQIKISNLTYIEIKKLKSSKLLYKLYLKNI